MSKFAWLLVALCAAFVQCRPNPDSSNNSQPNVAQPTQNDSLIQQKKREKAALPAKLDTIKVDPNAKKVETQ